MYVCTHIEKNKCKQVNPHIRLDNVQPRHLPVTFRIGVSSQIFPGLVVEARPALQGRGGRWVAYLEGVLGAVARAPDAHGLQHARIAQLLQNQLVIKTEFLLQRKCSGLCGTTCGRLPHTPAQQLAIPGG